MLNTVIMQLPPSAATTGHGSGFRGLILLELLCFPAVPSPLMLVEGQRANRQLSKRNRCFHCPASAAHPSEGRP